MADKEQTKNIEYTEDLQRFFIQMLISRRDLFTRCHNIIKPGYFESHLKPAVRYILNFAEHYQGLPTPEQIKAETNIDVPIIDGLDHSHEKWFLEEIERFCVHKELEHLVFTGPDLLAKGSYSELETRAKNALTITLHKDLGRDYWDNPRERLEGMKNRKNTVSTGWKSIDDKLYGGMNRGELSFFAGGPGSGKSLFLQNLALNWLEMGQNIIYITLELSEDLVSLRFDAMVTGLPTRDVFRKMDDVELKLGMAAKRMGKFTIKKLPEGGTTVNDIRAYLNVFETQTGVKIDGIAVDYLDLLHPNNRRINPSDLFVKDKYTSEELRGLASEWNVLAATASQLNRASVEAQEFDQSHIAGGISKINTADNVMAIYTSALMRERGEYQIQFLKTRSSSGVGSKVVLKYDHENLRIRDMEEGEEARGPKTLDDLRKDVKGATVTRTPAAGASTNTPITQKVNDLRALVNRVRND